MAKEKLTYKMTDLNPICYQVPIGDFPVAR